MIHLPGYRVHEQLYKSGDVTIYRGTGDKENTPVVIKLLDKEYPTEEQLARLRREYKITRSLSGDGIIRAYSLEKYGNSLAIILEDFGGRPLEKILSQYQPAPDEKLALAISMAEALALVHRQNIAHKDINPANFLLNRETMQVKIIDFGIATELPRENPEIRNPNVLEGTLAYLSPEQTGRMNRAMDYRTDMYSLGVTYYELFTGQLPFKTDDAMEMVHCHIAKTPGSPERINPEIPGPVSRIIMKLLSKTAEERYQNTMGIVHDLNVCLDKLQSTGEITEFHIGQHDISDRFRIPQKLYGREQEIAAMHAAFNRTGEGAKEMILVAGEPGIGKSALVHEVTRSITEKRGHFITGKFEQLKRDIPYAAFLQAFRELVKSLLAESEERLLALKEKLILALGPSGQVIIDVIPEVELIIGEQPAVGELDPTRAGNRFELVFQNFVRVFANKESPLVIFIDDLQWTDLPSLKLIELFMTDEETRYLLIIGAYRDNEVGLSHPLPMLLKGLLEAGCTADTISLRPLELKFISELLAETLLCHPDAAYALADLCAQKTLGNPFFLNRLLYSLYEEHLIDFDAQEGIWTYDIIEIKDVGITDNVVELMVEKIRKLDPDTQAIIILAACIGNQFHLDTLVVVSELTKNETAQHLSRILQENLAAPTDDSYKFMLESRGDLTAGFRFLHDRIQQAAYSLISEERKKEVHLKIGRLLLSTVPEKDLDDTIFNIANHLNLGSELIRDQFEKDTLAELNLRAGQKAKISAAYKPAYDYFKTGIALVTVSPWTRKYDLCRLLHEEGAEAEYLSGEYEESEKILSALMANAITIPHRLKGEEIRILTYMSRGRFKETIDASLDILRLLGEKFPAEPKKRHILAELIRVKLALSGKTDEQLLSAGEITDPVILAKGRILCRTESAAFVSRPFLYPLIIFKGLRIVVGNGVDPSYSSNVFAAFGIILCSMGDIDGGYRFGKLGEEMLKRSRVKDGKTKLLMVTNTFIRHWKEHIKETLKPLLLAYESRLETGDIEYAFYAAMFYCSHLFSSGKKLKEVEKERYKFREAAKELNQDLVSTSMNIHHQMVLNLLNPEELSTVLCGTSFDEESMLPHLHKKGNQAALLLVYGMKLILSYLAGFYREALDFSRYVVQYINASRATFSITIYNFYESLTLLALGENIKKVTKNQKKMKKWAFHAPMNHLQKWHLVEAEKARVLGSDEKAKEHYKEAIKNAKENEFIQDEALGYELYARFLLRRGEEEFAAFIMRKAYYCYAAWGAAAKLTQLKEKYPGLLAETAAESGRGEETKRGTSESLDISSIIKTTQTISGEIVLEELLKKTIAIALENAGAQKGFFIIKSNELLTIEVQVDNAATTVFKSIPVDESGELARSIVQYVSRTGNDLILNDAANDTRFAKDSYIVKNKPRSILCASITHKGKTSGILYLENNLAPHAFTPERLELLRIFSAQAAISIENASLYQNLEKKVKDRTVELEKANEKLKELDKLKTGFFTNISHDIRTPLTLILTPVESALQGDYKKDVDENFLKNIQRNGIRLLKLINNLLDFAKIEAGRMDLKMKEVDIVRLMKSYWNYIHSTVESNELRFSFYSERKSMNVFLDIDKTDKIAMNLFSNSLKFTEKGGEMAMRITEDERSCFIEFSDTGVGIPPDKIDIIFDRFGQAATGPSRGYEGSGIGLALVKELVEMQGGTIKVESRYINDHPKDHGTVFTIQYPKGSERLANQDEIEFVPGSELEETAADPWFAGIRELRDLGGEENYKPVSVEMRSLKETNGAALLIVEDNSGMRNFLVSLFKNSYSLTTAVNGREGFEKARELKPDLVITDVMMPELDGNEMTRMLKEDKELKSIPVIMLTAKARVAQKIEGLEYGADDYVTKPFNSRELMARVRSLLEKRENQRALAERNRVIEDELAVARLLQQKLMPAHLPEISGYRAAVQYIPMDAVGGDFYDFKTNEDSIELFIADVSGHGLPGAFLSMITKMAFENIRERSSTKNVLYQINDVICRYTVQNNFVTAFYCIINRDTNVMKFSSAGHFPQFIYRESNNTFYDLNTKGRPLGWFSDLQLEEKEISLKADDRVILYTDGITESENPGNKLFGIGSFKDFVQESRAHSPEEFTHAIIAHLKEYSEKEEFDDDLCLIVFDVL